MTWCSNQFIFRSVHNNKTLLKQQSSLERSTYISSITSHIASIKGIKSWCYCSTQTKRSFHHTHSVSRLDIVSRRKKQDHRFLKIYRRLNRKLVPVLKTLLIMLALRTNSGLQSDLLNKKELSKRHEKTLRTRRAFDEAEANETSDLFSFFFVFFL